MTSLRMRTFSMDRHTPSVDPRVQNIGVLHGFTVWIVDGGMIRNHIDVEFALGGNPGRYKYVPFDEIWIEDTGDMQDMLATAEHEVIECDLMIYRGWTYDRAHAEASKRETKLRGMQ